MQQLVSNGNTYPGARYVYNETPNDGTRKDLSHDKRSAELQLRVGQTVERHIVDDDLLIFNRQPTLHKGSMMGHRVKVCHDRCSPTAQFIKL